MKNFNRRSQFPWSPRLKPLQSGVTRTLTWIARIQSHTYINIATTTLCEAPAQLLLFSACWVFSAFCNLPNSDMDYRIFIVYTSSLFRVHIYTYSALEVKSEGSGFDPLVRQGEGKFFYPSESTLVSVLCLTPFVCMARI